MMSQLLRMTLLAVLLGSSASVLGQRGDPISSKHSLVDVEAGRGALQQEFLKLRFGMFLHFNMATYVDREWANGYEDPAIFKPDRLDCNQWADVACAAGMKYGVLTVKHTGGWCLWDSKHTTYDISNFINYKNGKGDIVREFVNTFRARGLKVGFYYCFPGDFSNTRHGNAVREGKPDLHGLPPEAAGDYVGFIKLQLTELLTKYGPIDLLWIDQYSNKYTLSRWQEILAHIKSLQPQCLVIGNNAHNLKDSDVYSCEFPWDPKSLPPEGNKIPAEVCDKISRTWFWNTGDKAEHVRDAREIVKMLKLCNERNANYLLNVPPDRNGLISGIHLERMEELAAFASAQGNSKPDRKAGNKVLPVKGYELYWSDEFEGKVLDFEKWDYRGLGPLLAQNIVDYRNENGPFESRQELKTVPRLGAKAFEQAAGFLRIRDVVNPLDSQFIFNGSSMGLNSHFSSSNPSFRFHRRFRKWVIPMSSPIAIKRPISTPATSTTECIWPMMKNNVKRKMQRANHPHFERGKKMPFFAHRMGTKNMPKQKMAKMSQISRGCCLRIQNR